jgi:hypothetical protein
MRVAVLVLALLAATAARADDLLQVWARARAADPVLRQAAALAGAQEASAREARAALLPQWQVQSSELRDTGGARSRVTTSSLSQTLLDLAALREWDASRSLASAQAARLVAAEQDARARVARAYFGLLSAEAQLATARANEEAFARQVNEAEARFKAGLSAQVEADQSRAYRELALTPPPHVLDDAGRLDAQYQRGLGHVATDPRRPIGGIVGPHLVAVSNRLDPLAERVDLVVGQVEVRERHGDDLAHGAVDLDGLAGHIPSEEDRTTPTVESQRSRSVVPKRLITLD